MISIDEDIYLFIGCNTVRLTSVCLSIAIEPSSSSSIVNGKSLYISTSLYGSIIERSYYIPIKSILSVIVVSNIYIGNIIINDHWFYVF